MPGVRGTGSPVARNGTLSTAPGSFRLDVRLVAQLAHDRFNAFAIFGRQREKRFASGETKQGIEVAHDFDPFRMTGTAGADGICHRRESCKTSADMDARERHLGERINTFEDLVAAMVQHEVVTTEMVYV